MNVCFTGHRKINVTENLLKKLESTLEQLIIQGAEDFYAGGAIGWDILCELEILNLRKKYPHIKLHLVLPCSSEEQTRKWSKSDRNQYYEILEKADNIEYVSEHYFKGCMKKRNFRLVEYAECCICYCKKKASGTGQTVRMAEKKMLR